MGLIWLVSRGLMWMGSGGFMWLASGTRLQQRKTFSDDLAFTFRFPMRARLKQMKPHVCKERICSGWQG